MLSDLFDVSEVWDEARPVSVAPMLDSEGEPEENGEEAAIVTVHSVFSNTLRGMHRNRINAISRLQFSDFM